MIYIDADQRLTTWRYIADAGGYQPYCGQAGAGDIILRWGANHNQYTYPDGVRILNPHLVLSKRAQHDLLREHNVPVPPIFTSRIQWDRAGSPQLIVKPDRGQMGNGVRLVRNPGWDSRCIYQAYLPKEREFRAMVVHNILAFFMEKHPPENGDIRWNAHQGSQWTSVPADHRLRGRIREIGQQALAAIGYDYGAIDIILYNQNLYVLEINSRPEFGESNAARFVRAINSFLGSQ